MRRRLFTAACVASAVLWLGWLALSLWHFWLFPLELGSTLAEWAIGLVVLGIVPAIWVHMRDVQRATAERKAGFCRACGYNLL